MTTKPKARKFRIRRSAAAKALASGPQREGAVHAAGRRPDALAHQVSSTSPSSGQAPAAPIADQTRGSQTNPEPGQPGQPPNTIDAIRREGLTGRQLRIARRVAEKNGLLPVSDYDAVRLLRDRNIDPFSRESILDLIRGRQKKNRQEHGTGTALAPAEHRLPQTIEEPPSSQENIAYRRNREIQKIQHEIAKRRRRKLLLLLTRLTAFVFLPTFVVWYYYATMATPMYTSKSSFQILTADGAGSSPASGLFQGTSLATSQDAIATQDFLESKAAMLRLDKDVGFRSHFSQPEIDPVQRLEDGASQEDAYSLYSKYITLGYDPTEGVIRMEITTADPETSVRFSRKLIEYAEENVDKSSLEKREDALKTSTGSLEQARAERRAAQARLVKLQETSLLDPEGEIASIRGLVTNVATQLQEKQLALNIQLNNIRPNQSRVDALESEISVLRAELVKQKNRLNKATEGEDSLASQTADIKMAEADVLTADMILQAALETKRQSEIEANKQVRYMTVNSPPVQSEDPSYPKIFENTVLAFLIFAGIYLMISLTASILREQVSS